MGHEKVGPKEAAQRLLRDQKYAKPSKADLRSKIAKIRPMTKQTGRRGR